METFFDYLQSLNLRVVRAVAREEDGVLTPCGLSPRHAPYLLKLRKRPEGMTCAELSREVHFDKANTTRVVRDLVAAGVAGKEEGGRSCRIYLTERGERLAADLFLLVRKKCEEVLSELPPEDKAHLLASLKKLTREG